MAEHAPRPRRDDDPVRDDPVRVLFVAGTGRSGSTLVTTILGQLPGVFAAGELRFLWQRGAVQDQRCGCGERFSACPVWSSVMAATVPDGRVRETAQEVAGRLRRRTRARRVPAVLARMVTARRPLQAHPDDALLVDLYRAVRDRSGADVVVDSSKLPLYGLLLQALPGVEVTVLHLVRDPRAAAYSWLRERASRQCDDDPPMDRQHVLKSATLWVLWNLVAALAWRPHGGQHLRLRYEDLVHDPTTALAPVLERLGAPAGSLPFLDRRTLRIAPTHAVAGNPSRHVVGHVEVRDDSEWRTGLPAGQRAVVRAVTKPARTVLRWTDQHVDPTAPVGSEVLDLATLEREAAELADRHGTVPLAGPAGPPA